ncbi:MAG: sugar phosphorylase [Clostridium sp.]|uniref:sugar phosphorylase n=1 Tax=Clostridium sp. TaxID=1506 RepID=UPI003F31C68F
MDNKTLLFQIEEKLKLIYGKDYNESYLDLMKKLISKWEDKDFKITDKVSEKNVFLITYGDSFYNEGEKTLSTLNNFLKENVEDAITDVHLLPMFEYTSDDGFSVVDYMKIDENLGDWNNIKELSKDYRLMFDFVANHMSKSSEWFKGYINGEEEYKNFFIKEDEKFDSHNVVRPRTSPLFHSYEGNSGIKTAWTTFSEDQVDLNFKDINVLEKMTDVLINYAYNGATSIRLDAIGFLWKESGTTCIHLEETHEVIKLWRILLDYFKNNTQIITETNVPHKENISYFGSGIDEAHMVYQFTLPPLVLYTLTTKNSSKLTEWAKTIDKVSKDATYFNFLSSHDGIGMRPVEGILNDEEKEILINKTLENGGKISYKSNSDGSKSAYELNINYNDALINKDEDIDEETGVNKILGAHSILLSLIGVPAIYYHSLLGSRNYYKGVEDSGINRRINREKLNVKDIVEELKSDNRRNSIFEGMKKLIKVRKEESAFSPYSTQKVLDMGEDLFGIERFNEETKEKITFIINITNKEVSIPGNINGTDILSKRKVEHISTLKPYSFVWVK